MIRFVDLTQPYFCDTIHCSPCCAFVSTTTDHFLQNGIGEQVFFDMDDIEEHREALRMKALIPKDFFNAK